MGLFGLPKHVPARPVGVYEGVGCGLDSEFGYRLRNILFDV